MYQNAMGTRLWALRSEASHCTTQRMKKRPWPKKPMPSQVISVVDMGQDHAREEEIVEIRRR
jgi:hypothetical protein